MDPVTLIFAGIALFVVFKLISVLGTRTGHEQSTDIEGLQRARRAEDDAASKEAAAAGESNDLYDLPKEDDEQNKRAPISIPAAPLRDADPDFDERGFIIGAKAAYEMIVQGFADGDLGPIKQFLTPDVYGAFADVVSERDKAGNKYDLTFVGVSKAEISKALVRDETMIATVSFMSDQVRAHYNRDGDLIDGDPSRVDVVRDEWTFSRPVHSTDPNWVLVATSA